MKINEDRAGNERGKGREGRGERQLKGVERRRREEMGEEKKEGVKLRKQEEER